jgi:hypothetical protein
MAAAVNCGIGSPTGIRHPLQRPGASPATRRYCAVSMQLAAYLDSHYVELLILTNEGESIAVICPRDSIFSLQQHIEQIGRECPEIARWS